MANPNIENETLSKGVRLTVIVEYSFENIIAVFLFHNGKEFRGVLLENDPGLFPHGIPFSNKPMVEQKASVMTSPRPALDIKPGTENKPPDVSVSKDAKAEPPATCGRFSYTTNPFVVNPRPVPDVPTVEMRPVGLRRKTIRDIRLRPRQTLCSKCKSAIHENLKGHSSSSGHRHTLTGGATEALSPNQKTLKENSDSTPSLPNDAQRKRKTQSPMVLLEDIKLKFMKPSENASKSLRVSVNKRTRYDHSTNKATAKNSNKVPQHIEQKPIATKTRSIRSSSLGSVSSGPNGNVHDWLQEIDSESESSSTVTQAGKHVKKDKNTSNESSMNSKPSPAIKISFGDGAILKIPPRLPENETQFNIQQSWPQTTDCCNSPANQAQHKKSKKAAKKSKDKDRCKAAISSEKPVALNSNSTESVGPKVQKKHKKKHRHRHDEPSESVPTQERNTVPETEQFPESQIALSEGPETVDDPDTNTVDDSSLDSKPAIDHPRPRLLYTWKQNQGLSRVSSSPKQPVTSMSPTYLFKKSPSVLPLSSSNSPHRRKNASPARVISASPNWHITSSQNVILKDYPLRSKSISGRSSSGLSSENAPASEHGVGQPSEDSQSHSSGVDSNISDFCDGDFGEGINSEEEFFFHEGSPRLERDDPEAEGDEAIKPLMMKIQTLNVDGCQLKDGREVHVGDIVWGKIPGFPWWPGRVSNITVTQRDNDVVITQLAKVCWFGSNTMSHVHCADLYPFLQEFKARYNKKKKGQYRVAIKQATVAAQMLRDAPEDDFSFEGYE